MLLICRTVFVVFYAVKISQLCADTLYKRDAECKFKAICTGFSTNLFLKKEDCDEIIIIKNSIVTDTSIANIAIFDGNIWLTSKNCLLKGTTRNRLLEDKFLVEKDITINMLKKASKIALMNAMIDFDIKENYSFKE